MRFSEGVNRSRAERNRLLLWGSGLILLILILDQVLKIWVKTHFYLGEEVLLIGSWARLHFTENNGIAFGLSPSSEWGKLLLSLLRLVATGVIGYIIFRAARLRAIPKGVVLGLMLVFAGALGNIIDGTFYGLIFSSSDSYALSDSGLLQPVVATIFPPEGGYAPLFHGKVVDMLYFPLFQFAWPTWIPLIGGRTFRFFDPVFNLADSAITIGVFYILIFHWRFIFPKKSEPMA